jgi:hypothetical protein
MVRRVGKIRGKGKREVTSSSSATSRRDLPPHLPPYLSEASCLLPLLDKYDNLRRGLSIFLLSFAFGF